jgi:hypothetical protein
VVLPVMSGYFAPKIQPLATVPKPKALEQGFK